MFLNAHMLIHKLTKKVNIAYKLPSISYACVSSMLSITTKWRRSMLNWYARDVKEIREKSQIYVVFSDWVTFCFSKQHQNHFTWLIWKNPSTSKYIVMVFTLKNSYKLLHCLKLFRLYRILYEVFDLWNFNLKLVWPY